MAKYRVDVYESRDDIFNDDGIMGMDFEFPDYDHMTKFVEQMVVELTPNLFNSSVIFTPPSNFVIAMILHAG